MMRRLLRCDAGTGAVEFGLVAPTLIFLLMGMVDVGRYLYFGILATHAAASGAQYGAQTLITAADNTSMQRAALADAPALTNAIATAVHVCKIANAVYDCQVSGATYFVQVQVTGTFAALIKYPGIPSSIPITATAVMRVANQ